MTTPRKTRAPRKPDPFRMSPVVSCTISAPMNAALLTYDPTNRSKTIRAALLNHAHKAKPIKVPAEFRPPKEFNQQVSVSLILKPESLRQEYEQHAKNLNITMSELILRCVYAYLSGKLEAELKEEII